MFCRAEARPISVLHFNAVVKGVMQGYGALPSETADGEERASRRLSVDPGVFHPVQPRLGSKGGLAAKILAAASLALGSSTHAAALLYRI